MKDDQVQIEIEAATERVWQVLTQEMPLAPVPYGITKFDGAIAPGAPIKLWSEMVPNRAFSLKVARLERPNVMVWRGGMPFGLFVGTRTFSITDHARGCTFQMREVFTGPLAGLITKSMPDLTPSFVKFAQTLKKEAEEQ